MSFVWGHRLCIMRHSGIPDNGAGSHAVGYGQSNSCITPRAIWIHSAERMIKVTSRLKMHGIVGLHVYM